MLHVVTPLVICGAFVFGIVLALIGSLKLTLVRKLELRETHVGALLSVLNLSLLPMMLLAGMMLDDFGARIVLLIGSLGTAAGLYFAGLSKSLAQTAASILVVGAGSAFLSVGSIVLMETAFYPDHLAASLNLGNVFFGLGALLTPPFLELLLERFSYRKALTVLAAIGLIPGLMAILTASDVFPSHMGSAHIAELFRSKVVVLTGIVLLFYLPLEWVLSAWSTTFLMSPSMDMSERRATLTFSGFWLCFLASRFVVALLMASEWIAPGVADAWLIIFAALGAGVILGNMAGARNSRGAAWGLLITGALMGPIFPTLVAILFQFVEPEQRGTAYGAMFSIGSLGGLLLPPIMGVYAGQRGIRTSWRIPIVLAFLISLVSIGLVLEWGFS